MGVGDDGRSWAIVGDRGRYTWAWGAGQTSGARASRAHTHTDVARGLWAWPCQGNRSAQASLGHGLLHAHKLQDRGIVLGMVGKYMGGWDQQANTLPAPNEGATRCYIGTAGGACTAPVQRQRDPNRTNQEGATEPTQARRKRPAIKRCASGAKIMQCRTMNHEVPTCLQSVHMSATHMQNAALLLLLCVRACAPACRPSAWRHQPALHLRRLQGPTSGPCMLHAPL